MGEVFLLYMWGDGEKLSMSIDFDVEFFICIIVYLMKIW